MIPATDCSTLLFTKLIFSTVQKFVSFNRDWWLFLSILCMYLPCAFSPRENHDCHSYKTQSSGDCSCLAYTEQIQFQAENLNNIIHKTAIFQLVFRTSTHGGMSIRFAEAHGPSVTPKADVRFWMGKETRCHVYKEPMFKSNHEKNISINY